MQIIVFEDEGFANLLPLVYSRAVFNLRVGFDNLLAKIEAAFGPVAGVRVRPSIEPALRERFPRLFANASTGPAVAHAGGVSSSSSGSGDQLWINGRLLVRSRFDLPPGSVALRGETILAARFDGRGGLDAISAAVTGASATTLRRVDLPESSARLIDYPWQAVLENPAEIERQFQSVAPIVLGRVYPGAHLLNEDAIHLGDGSVVKPCSVLDAENGPICIGEKVTISPNVTITGPCFIGDGSTIQSGANIRPGSSIGPVCKVGGEVEGSTIHAYSNKQHDGFLGHSYVGEWVNLGADTVTSDLKNTYGSVTVHVNGRAVDSGEMFVGAIIGDHSKTGIRVALPTGCIIGYACNVFVSAYAPKFVPSFSWLTDEGHAEHDVERALKVALKVVARRKREYSATEQALFRSIRTEANRHEHAA